MSRSTDDRAAPRRRADAERNVAAILDAAIEALADDLDASMAEIARRAGVVRATLYVHFPTRDVLLDAVTRQGIERATIAIAAAEPERGDADEALVRVITAAWRTLDRLHSIVAINARRPHSDFRALHEPVLDLLGPLIERGQRDGTFRAEVPLRWHLTVILALIHAASQELRNGAVRAEDIEPALAATVVGAVSGR